MPNKILVALVLLVSLYVWMWVARWTDEKYTNCSSWEKAQGWTGAVALLCAILYGVVQFGIWLHVFS